MAKTRMVNTRFWIDDYISHLDPIEKLLFLYFLTNPFTDICGFYEIPIKNIALDTGIDKEMVVKILGRFERDGKVFYRDGWIGIKNFAKHQLDNPKVNRGIELGLEKVPKSLVDIVNNSLSIVYDRLSHLNLNPNLNSNSKIRYATEVANPPKKPLKEEELQSLEEYVKSMRESPQRHINLIGEYADEIKPTFTTKPQWKVFTTRNLRPAKQLSYFTDEQIEKALNLIEKNKKTVKNPKGFITEWTLETLLKYLIK